MRKELILLVCLLVAGSLSARENFRVERDIPYIAESDTDSYRQARCKVDISYPTDKRGFPTVIWFHGGGLEVGAKHIPEAFAERGIAVVAVNYRLSPRAKNPAYTLDAAEAVAWTMRHIESFGGRKDRVFVTGHSAGGYLTLMLAMDKSYLARHGVDADSIAAYLPISGQTVTHYTIRKERRLPEGIPVIDRYAPVNNARAVTPPLVLITGDKDLEMTARYEENALLDAVLRGLGNRRVSLYEMEGFDHGKVYAPACIWIADYIADLMRREGGD